VCVCVCIHICCGPDGDSVHMLGRDRQKERQKQIAIQAMEPTRQVGRGEGGHALGTWGEVPVQDLGGGPSSSKLGRPPSTRFLSRRRGQH
jgi:hypothetical protein